MENCDSCDAAFERFRAGGSTQWMCGEERKLDQDRSENRDREYDGPQDSPFAVMKLITNGLRLGMTMAREFKIYQRASASFLSEVQSRRLPSIRHIEPVFR